MQTPHTLGGWLGSGAATLTGLAIFGRLLIEPLVRVANHLHHEVDRLRTSADDVEGMGPILVDHELRVQELEQRAGIRPHHPTRKEPRP